MHTIADSDIAAFVGAVVSSVDVLEYVCIVHFNHDLSVSCESKIALNGYLVTISAGVVDEDDVEALRSFEGRTVTSAKAIDGTDLHFVFSDRTSMTFLGENGPFEAYQIDIAGDVLVV